ncbi:MAG: HEAT repeat domain-containing protein, partial [Deltaproteobacteria bacterium]|nr:HEAT repeat domain-containing protein [Deltaproteobacteria bacterium]
MHNFYPGGHPNLDSALERSYALVKKAIDEAGEIKWRIDQKGFYSDKNPLAPSNPDAATLAKKVFFRRINAITFTSRITVKDMKVFLSMLRLEPEELAQKGGADHVLAAGDVTGILLNSQSYEDLLKIKKELEEKKRKEELVKEEKKKIEAEEGTSTKEEESKPPEEEEKTREESLAELLERIKDEKDAIRYRDLAARIKDKCALLLAAKKHRECALALFVFLDHTNEAWGMPEGIRSMAAERITECLDEEMLRHLIARVGNKDEPMRHDIQRILLHGGSPAIERLLDAVIAAPEAVSRRNYYNTIILFGPRIRTNVEARIPNAEWFVVRQMVSVLGDLGDEGALDALESAYKHEDARVKKEVLKSLVKLPSPRSTAVLIAAIEEQEESPVRQAVISHGLLKDTQAIDRLGKIALKRDPFAEP